jgi:hypothetical protein
MPYRPHKNRKKIPSVYARELLVKLLSFAEQKLENHSAFSFFAKDLGITSEQQRYNPAYMHYLDALGTLVALNLIKEKRNVVGNSTKYVMSRESFQQIRKFVT